MSPARKGRQEVPKDETAALLERAQRGRLPSREEVERMLALENSAPLVALLERDRRWKEHRDWLPWASYRRGVAECEPGECPWNEIFDALAGKSRWPSGPEIRNRYEALVRVGKWAAEEEREEALLALYRFQTEEVVARLHESAREVTPRLVERALERGLYLPVLARHPAMTEELFAPLYHWAMESLERGMQMLLGYQSGSYAPIARACSVLERRAEKARLPAECLERLIRGYDEMEGRMGEVAEKVRHRLASVLSSGWRSLPEAMYERAGEIMAAEAGWSCCQLARSEEVPLALLRVLARSPRAIRIRRTLAQNARAVADPEIAEVLSRSRTLRVAEKVAEQATGRAFRRSFRRVVEAKPLEALKLGERRGEVVAEALVARDLAPIFSETEAETRERALRLVGRLPARR